MQIQMKCMLMCVRFAEGKKMKEKVNKQVFCAYIVGILEDSFVVVRHHIRSSMTVQWFGRDKANSADNPTMSINKQYAIYVMQTIVKLHLQLLV